MTILIILGTIISVVIIAKIMKALGFSDTLIGGIFSFLIFLIPIIIGAGTGAAISMFLSPMIGIPTGIIACIFLFKLFIKLKRGY